MQLTNYGVPIGTPFYMSPEQWFGDGPGFTSLDGRTDIYALGCTLYEALSGSAPFTGQNKEELRRKHLNEPPRPLDEIASHVPESVSRVILRALEKDRDFRPASAAEFAAELQRAFNESRGSAIDEEALKRSRATTNPPESVAEQLAPKQISQMQTTEEVVPVIRNWAAGEAQAAIEQVRERPLAITQEREIGILPQAEVEPENGPVQSELAVEVEDPEVTLEPGKFRFEAEQLNLDERAAASFAKSEMEQTLILQPESKMASSPAPELSGAEVQAGESREACELLLAQAGAWHIGLLAGEVESVNTWRSPVPLPHAPPAVLGVVSVRGRMLTVIDPSVLLGEGDAKETKAVPAFIIALRGDEQLALAVNRVDGSIGIFAAEIELPATGAAANVTRGVIQGAHGQTVVLDTREMFPAAMQGAERRRKR
jgi:chemotaxis signal transduction protein